MSSRAATQAQISAEIAGLPAGEESGPRLDFPPYRSSALRHPHHPLHPVDPDGAELAAPCFGLAQVDPAEADLTTRQAGAGEALGERILVAGRVLDGSGRPVAGQLVEIWQANSAGRYAHAGDEHPAPLDPNFSGVGRCLTGPNGSYRFTTIKPGPYPWRNHLNAWRPAHIHFSLFGTEFTQRLVTQMYFPADPLQDLDPIFRSVGARARLIADYDHGLTQPEWATGYRWNIVLTGSHATPRDDISSD
ncbi:MAG TPA: protocatechuate 3,4-dioxygenase subunit beta [Sporichthya sp.]|nr:protocatechuate 3,4-dioxygenase subunit beta [Sporichthya sp.]